MSVERLVMRALLLTSGARLVSTGVQGIAGIVLSTGRLIEDAAQSFVLVESHFGREYEKLTGQDLAELLGEPGLYEGDPQTEELVEGEDEEY
jgi:hypothetical protein